MKIRTFALLMIASLLCLSTVSRVEAKAAKARKIAVSVTEEGFVPNKIEASAGENVVLNITRKTDSTCAKSVTVPSLNLKKDLPLNKMVALKLGKLEKGEIKFGCGMEMMVGAVILVQ